MSKPARHPGPAGNPQHRERAGRRDGVPARRRRLESIEISGIDAPLRLATIGLDVALAAIYRGVPGLAD